MVVFLRILAALASIPLAAWLASLSDRPLHDAGVLALVLGVLALLGGFAMLVPLLPRDNRLTWMLLAFIVWGAFALPCALCLGFGFSCALFRSCL